MVIAHWLIGREIVLEIQSGKQRAKYGEKIIDNLATHLKKHFGRGFSSTNLRYFRQFYKVYSDRIPKICHNWCGELTSVGGKQIRHTQSGILKDMSDAILIKDSELGFSPNLGWAHYKELMRVDNPQERLFYEIEAGKEKWNLEHLKRQIHTHLFARLLKSKDKDGVLCLSREGNALKEPSDMLKNPYVLDFLGIPDSKLLHESKLEQAIIDNIQSFLLELGKGFAFIARQKRISTETKEFYIDLVFYNYHLKCFVLVDLKTGGLSHQDIGQMDMYVRMFDDLQRGEGDNPTVGLILCPDKDRTIVKYSVLSEHKQLFAAQYLLYLPGEEELVREIEKERKLIDNERFREVL